MKKPGPVVLFIFGTRPEALKLAPLIHEARRRGSFDSVTCLTGQHRQMVDQVLKVFDIKVDHDLDLMQAGQTPGSLTARTLPAIESVFHRIRPDLAVVQGDTTTAFAAGLQAFYSGIPLAHVEAGLRTYNKQHPFPEEINRVLLSHLSRYHFAPTAAAKANLLREGIPASAVHVTGNTVVDALEIMKKDLRSHKPSPALHISDSKRIILVTSHRRESFGQPLRDICGALTDLTRRFPDIEIVYPVHLNPNVRETAVSLLSGLPRIHLLEPLSYVQFLYLLERCHLVLTDSGGVQEEAPSFRKPVLVMREVSERNEGVKLGIAKIVGTSRRRITSAASKLLSDERAYRSMIRTSNPYGDGKASSRIVKVLNKILKGSR